MESYVPTYGSNKPDVSAASVGWQIRHSLKVIISVSKALKRSDPKDYKWTFNWKRSMMLTIGRFARGKVNSPKHTRTDVDIESSEVNKLLSQARETMLETEILSPTASFPHPIFGSLNLSQSQKSLALHTYHHLLIIRDIMA